MNGKKAVKPTVKPLVESKTVRVGTFYIGLGSLAVILQLFDFLGSILKGVNLEDVPSDKAAWVGLFLAFIGVGQVWLRKVTTQPIGNEDSSPDTESKDPE